MKGERGKEVGNGGGEWGTGGRGRGRGVEKGGGGGSGTWGFQKTRPDSGNPRFRKLQRTRFRKSQGEVQKITPAIQETRAGDSENPDWLFQEMGALRCNWLHVRWRLWSPLVVLVSSVVGSGLIRWWLWSCPLVVLVSSVGGFGLVRWWFWSRPLVGLVLFVGGSGHVRWWFWSRPLVFLVSSVGARKRLRDHPPRHSIRHRFFQTRRLQRMWSQGPFPGHFDDF